MVMAPAGDLMPKITAPSICDEPGRRHDGSASHTTRFVDLDLPFESERRRRPPPVGEEAAVRGQASARSLLRFLEASPLGQLGGPLHHAAQARGIDGVCSRGAP